MIALVNPPLWVLRRDPLTTGIVYMPLSLAHLAGALRDGSLPYRVIDGFGEAVNQVRVHGEHIIRGLRTSDIVKRIPNDTSVLVIYAGHVMSHGAVIEIAGAVKASRPGIPVVLMQNSQAVTAYSLPRMQSDIHAAGIDFVVTGDPESHCVPLLRRLISPVRDLSGLTGVGHLADGGPVFTPPALSHDEFILPKPAWSDFPLESYWRLRYAHGPLESRRYLPVLTSRGCPGRCAFCVAPETNQGCWRPRSIDDVVDEWAWLVQTHNVHELHVEDMNPTVSESRTRALCEAILDRDIHVTWKLVSGTKLEFIRDPSTVDMLGRAGCRYISFSPESGSADVLRNMHKAFDRDHAFLLLARMRAAGIYTQACFVLGFPGETDADRQQSLQLAEEMTRRGVDEIAVFIITPLPGAPLYEQISDKPRDHWNLSFSPTWRSDYDHLQSWRMATYRRFILTKMRYHPLATAAQCARFMTRRFRTKMEMAPYRALHTMWLARRQHHEE